MANRPVSAAARSWRLEQPILDATLNQCGQWALVTMGDGSIAKLPAADTGVGPEVWPLHNGVSLSLCADAEDTAFLSGGDDGKLYLIDPEVDVPTLLAERQGAWIDHVAASPLGPRAYACGKTLFLLNEAGQALGSPQELPGAIGGLAFSPDGLFLAVSHYGGVQIIDVMNRARPPLALPWKGSFLNVLWGPDGKTLFAALQDGGLHGWRLPTPMEKPREGDEMHMSGYTGKPRSLAFSAGGKNLVTSGAAQAVCWPFLGGDPQNKQPLLLGGVDARLVRRVAPHPTDDMVAVGYDDGMIVFAPLDGRMEILVHPPLAPQGAAVVGLGWNNEGDTLVAALESGHVMLFTIASVSKFVRG